MASIVRCPECQRSLRLSEAVAGKRVRCPDCKHGFVAPGGEEEPDIVECAIAEEPVKRPAKRPSRDEEDEDPPPRSRRDEDDEDDDEEAGDRRSRSSSRSRRRRIDHDISAPMKPLVYGIGSCVLFCAPAVGMALAGLAHSMANKALDDLPPGRRARSARKQLERAKLLGTIGFWISLGWGTILLVLWAVNGFKR